jgi:uncharacterized protein YqeY
MHDRGVNLLHHRGDGRQTLPARQGATKEIIMAIETQLMDLLKDAMRAKDSRTADCIRMIKTKHMERRTAAGFKAPLDDALWVDVITAYQKQLRKSREEYAGLGERGKEALPQIDFEIEFCARFLPKAASDDEVRAAVREAIAAMGTKDPKLAGKVMGEVMKAHKGKFEPPTVKRIVEEELK